MFRCRTKWYEEGEKSSKYFFNLEKFNFNKRVMKSTHLPDGSITRDPNMILKEQNSFYKKLLTSDKNVKFDLENYNDPKISNREKQMLDQKLTIEDLGRALKDICQIIRRRDVMA